jgi:hypothetical protein
MAANMIKYLRGVFLLCCFIPLNSSGQDTGPGLDYQATVIDNPAVTGSEGDGLIRLSYLNFYPGNNYDLHSVRLSYDGYFHALHGGAGFYLSDNYLGGIVNYLKGGFSYYYFFQAGEKLFISAGLSASFYHRGYNLGGAILPDQIDPLGGAILPPGEYLASRGKTVLDLGTGFLFMAGRIYGGIAVTHLAEPDMGETDIANEKLRRKLLLHIVADLGLGKEQKLKLFPAGKLELGNGFLSAGTGASMESKYLSVNSILLYNSYRNLDLQAGFSINTGSLLVFYNYRFNIVSGNSMLPFSILHHTGIAFRLNNVDKRKTVKTINFPEL